MTKTLKVGTRASVLAVAQTETVAAALRAAGHAVELVRITTPGDQSTKPIAEIGVGVFTSALREALRAGAIDLAVHSYKDLPTTKTDNLLDTTRRSARDDPRTEVRRAHRLRRLRPR